MSLTINKPKPVNEETRFERAISEGTISKEEFTESTPEWKKYIADCLCSDDPNLRVYQKRVGRKPPYQRFFTLRLRRQENAMIFVPFNLESIPDRIKALEKAIEDARKIGVTVLVVEVSTYYGEEIASGEISFYERNGFIRHSTVGFEVVLHFKLHE
jgi:hypothetical protein